MNESKVVSVRAGTDQPVLWYCPKCPHCHHEVSVIQLRCVLCGWLMERVKPGKW